MSRMPVPNRSRATSCVTPLILSSSLRTSPGVRTTGSRCDGLAWTTP